MKVQGSHKKNGRLKLLQHLTKYWWLQSWSWSSLVWLKFQNWNATSMFFGLSIKILTITLLIQRLTAGLNLCGVLVGACTSQPCATWFKFGLVWFGCLSKAEGAGGLNCARGVGRGLYWTTLWPTSSTQEGSPVWLYSVHPLNHAHVLFEHSPVAECVSTLNI